MTHDGKARRFVIVLRGRSIDLAFWMKMAFAVGILFVIPLEFNYFEAIQPVPATNYYNIWISSAMLDYIDWAGRGQATTEFSNPLTVAAAFVICIPSIILNRRIRNQKATDSIRDIAAASLFGTAVITVYVVDYFPPPEISWLVGIFPQWKLIRFGTLAIFALIIFPLMIREASHQGFHRKHRILASAFFMVAALMPTVFAAGYPERWVNYLAISPAYQFSYEISIPEVPWQPIPQFYISYATLETMSFMYGLAYTGLHLIFGFYVLQYLHGQTSRCRVFLLGAVSILVPYGYIVYQTVAADAAFPVVVIPLPILLIFGTVILIVSEPVVEPQVAPTIDLMPREERIIVPVAYMLKSKLVGFKERIAKIRNRS